MKCVDCKHGVFQTTHNGKRLKPRTIGKCLAAIPPVPVMLSVHYARPSPVGIWADTEGHCDSYEAKL